MGLLSICGHTGPAVSNITSLAARIIFARTAPFCVEAQLNDNFPLVGLNDICAMTSLSRTSVNKKRAAGTFPQAVPLGERRVAFVRAEVVEWIESRIAARDTKAGRAA